MSLKSRLERLERQHANLDHSGLPPLFWESIWRLVPVEEMHPETRRLIEELCQDGREAPDPIKEAIRRVGKVPGCDCQWSR